ncbi:MAG: contractile injection system protein, VgrG/Pvc8 family [Candidatus Reddybacter sp.]
MKPAWHVTANSIALNDDINARVDSIEYHDATGDEADQLTIEFDDHDNSLHIPPTGAALSLMLGWAGSALYDKGTFVVDEAEHAGSPDKIIITARSADFRAAFKVKRSTSWDAGLSLPDLLSTIASRYTLSAKVGPTLASINLQQITQSDESDSNLLRRLGKQHDAVATVKNGFLLFFPKGQGKTVAGTLLPSATIARHQTTDHSYKKVDKKTAYTGVEARWYDSEAAKQQSVLAGSAGKLKKLRTPLPDSQQATEAAYAEWQRVQRGAATMSLTVAPGMPELVNGQPVTLHGWKATIDAHEWLIDDLHHNISGSGLITQVELVTRV